MPQRVVVRAGLLRAGVLKAAPFSTARAASPATVIVYSGDADELKAFAKATGVPDGVVLIPDPSMKWTNAYGVDPCPPVFVLDQKGELRSRTTARRMRRRAVTRT